MTDYLKSVIDQEFTPSEQKALLIQVKNAIGDGRMYEFYREPRNGKNVLMVRRQKK